MTNIAIEVGGTFTDLIWINSTGEICTHKVPSTPDDPSQGVVRGMQEALGKDLAQISRLTHGSTVATNAVLERKGCRAALLTTEGFRDLLVLQRQLRPNVYAIACRKPQPLIPLDRTAEVVERLDAGGNVVKALDEVALMAAAEVLFAADQPEAVAVCLLHSYRDSTHERRVREILQARFPGVPVILSAETLPTFREYERASTTAMAAYLAPLVDRYLSNLESFLSREAGDAVLFIMQSSGGVLPSEGARNQGVDMLNSGPAAGVIAATRIAQRIGDGNIITLDVGGTSADVCLVTAGSPAVVAETAIDGLPVGRPSVDIANVGAGGGSIGWIDQGGMLQVGPQSAGAKPGPACYGHGGSAATLTDSLVHLGWLRPHRFLGGRLALRADLAATALAAIALTLRQDSAVAAQAMLDISVAHVSRCVRLVSVQRGFDPKDYVLYGYGGMGPMVAALAATELKIRRVIIPPYPGLFSAVGLLVADLKRVYRATHFEPVTDMTPREVSAGFGRLKLTAEREFAAYGCRPDQIQWECSLEMRHRGQGFELLVPIDLEQLLRQGVPYLMEAFATVHRSHYGAATPGYPADIVTYRLVAQAPTTHDAFNRLTASVPEITAPQLESGHLIWTSRRTSCQFAWRGSLPAGYVLAGCSVIEEPTATTFVPPGWTATVHDTGALTLAPGELSP